MLLIRLINDSRQAKNTEQQAKQIQIHLGTILVFGKHIYFVLRLYIEL